MTLSLTVNETLKWLSSLPVLMQELFWGDNVVVEVYNRTSVWRWGKREIQRKHGA